MITKANLKQLLSLLGYKEVSPKRFKREFASFDCCLEVDLEAEKLIYPQDKGLKVNDDTTSNFSKPENFVVFECINRLLEKGYRPEHIEIEKKWALGHDRKGGKGDICIYDIDGKNMLQIIECKTYGTKYKEALKILRIDGGQLFSYWQQERSTKWISLYASDIVDGAVVYENDIIDCSDDANLKLLSKKDDSLKLYSGAHTVGELLEAWKETYIMKLWQGLIFGNDSTAYKIGVKPLRKKDLKELTEEYREIGAQFAEILRHNNVSDKENAFNRLVALFICKLVDETRKGDNDEVDFQYKQGTDTYESLQDRLQRLHQEGMLKFMNEEMFYVPVDYPERLFAQYSGAQRKKAIEDLKEKIRILKFYSNNDFSFKDVHNEDLFLQNGKILVEIVQLFEKYRIVYPSKHQFLGNLFEGLLSDGFRQDEGQFFTPIPITRFIWDSLPIREYILNKGGKYYPRVIDYACGAGHFLTEAVEAINSAVDSDGNNKWVRDCIFGIEKDYRLARVAKISLFMNGAGDGNILFGDGLDNYKDQGVDISSFDILVANPPYSVKAFKPHLKLKNNELLLLDAITDKSKEIETLFVERLCQLLKPQAIAAVILPSTILTSDTSYTSARELLLKHFIIRGIVELGENTFGATPTNTVILFLEKYNEPPKIHEMIYDSVDSILNANTGEWGEDEILTAYLQHIDINKEDYYALIDGSCLFASEVCDYAKMYVSAFNESSDVKKKKRSKIFLNMSDDSKKDYLTKLFTTYIYDIEKEKLVYFALSYKNHTTIITCPTDNAQKQEFLGFKWSKRDKNLTLESIKEGGLIYVPDDRMSEECLAAAIRSSYLSKHWNPTDSNADYVKVVKTVDMMDFSRERFIKDLLTTASIKVSFISKHPLIKLSELVETIGGLWTGEKAPFVNAKVVRSTNFTNDCLFNDTDIIEIEVEQSKFEKRQLKKGDIIIEKSGGSAKQAVGRVIFFDKDEDGFSFSNFTNRLRVTSDKIIPEYLYIILSKIYMDGYTFGYQTGASNLKNLNIDKYLSIKVPVPENKEVQKSLVDAYKKIDEEYLKSRLTIKEYSDKISHLFAKYDVAKWGRVKLLNNQIFTISIGKRVLSDEMNNAYNIPVYSANVKEPFGMIDKLLIDDFSKGSVLWGIDGDWMVNYIPAGVKFYPTDHCGVLRVDETKMNPHFVMFMLDIAGQQAAFNRSNRASIDRIKSLSIPNVPLDIQNKVMAEVEEYEAIIVEAQAKMSQCAEQKKEILKKYIE